MQSAFQCLDQNDLRVKPSKCEFFKTSVTYLGHMMSDKGISTDPERISTVKDWPVTHDLKSMRQLLGFTGFYHKFVENYTRIIQSLNLLLQGHGLIKSPRRIKKPPNLLHLGFGAMPNKSKLISPPVLAYADYALPFIVHTDTSALGRGAVLYQKQDGLERVIANASRNLKPTEKKISTSQARVFGFKVVHYR